MGLSFAGAEEHTRSQRTCTRPARRGLLSIALAERARFASVFRHNQVQFEPFAGGVMGWGAPDTWQSMAYGRLPAPR